MRNELHEQAYLFWERLPKPIIFNLEGGGAAERLPLVDAFGDAPPEVVVVEFQPER